MRYWMCCRRRRRSCRWRPCNGKGRRSKAKPKEENLLPTPETNSELLKGDRIVEETQKQDEKIRPQTIQEYVGQKDLKDVLDIAIRAAKGRGECLDHLLLYGPPGLGKTTMSLILAGEMGVNCKISSAPSLERQIGRAHV